MSKELNEDLIQFDKGEFTDKKIKIVPKPEKNIGVDLNNEIMKDISYAGENDIIDMSKLENFLNVSQNREAIYKLIDTMARDSTLSSVLGTYAEDVTETNDNGQVMWCESADPDVQKYVTYLLDSLNVDKHLYGWAYSLIKYGDLYLRLFRESDYEDPIFDKYTEEHKKSLNEDIILKVNKPGDHYVHYVEAVNNPGEMFELTRYGKTMGYIKAPVRIINEDNDNGFNNINLFQYKYSIKNKDVEVYQATDFVHAYLEDTSSRVPEEISLFQNDNDLDTDTNAIVYKVRRGQSLFYDSFKIWRELSLLENSILLNRLTKSSIVRIIQCEVGDMGKEEVMNHLRSIKSMVEQKSAINTNNSMQEYTNPGPIENNIYVPTHDGKGNITTAQLGGDQTVEPKSLVDLDYFRDKMFANLRVPKQFFGFVDDAAGFSGGTSLSIISSRYAKSVKRYQNVLCQAVTDLINLIILDAGIPTYINKFTLRMQQPSTQEEADRRSQLSEKIRYITDVQSFLGDVQDESSKLKITKALLSTVVSDSEVLEILQEEIDKLDKQEELGTDISAEPDEGGEEPIGAPLGSERPNEESADEFPTLEEPTEGEEVEVKSFEEPMETASQETEDTYLPSFDELGIDGVGNGNNEEE